MTTAATGARAPFVRGRFEARFRNHERAQAAARDARTTGFVVDVCQEGRSSWLVVGRRKDAFPLDERDRYASRLKAIAIRHEGVYNQFVAE